MATRRSHARMWPPFLIGYLLNSIVVVYCIENILYDSAEHKNLNWTTFKAKSESSNLGWRESSANVDGGSQLRRIYASCAIKTADVDNWLRMPFIQREGANSLHINLTFTMRKCSKIIGSSNLQQCKETINLYYFGADSDFANQWRPTWDATTYHKVDKIAADELFEQKNDKAVLNTESRQISLSPDGPSGVYFAIQDQGACVALIRVVVYYIACPNVTRSFVHFDETPTGPTRSSVIRAKGRCVGNAIQKSTEELTYLCRNNGEWYDVPKGECACKAGYTAGGSSTECIPCSPNNYKWSEGGGPCLPCPKYSHSEGGAEECTCWKDFGRSPRDPKSNPCTQPPSAPMDPKITSLTFTKVNLTWSPPYDNGGRDDLVYRIVCEKCGSKVKYKPGTRGFDSTSVVLTNLDPGQTYEVIIFAENGVSNITNNAPRSVSVNFVTESVGTVLNVRKSSLGTKHLTISWSIPPSLQGKVTEYQIRYFPRMEPTKAVNGRSTATNFTISEFMQNTEYVFVVRAKTNSGWGGFSEPLFVPTGENGATVVEVRRVSLGPKHMTIAWDVPPGLKNAIKGFEVLYYPVGQKLSQISVYTKGQNVTMRDFVHDTEYQIQVRSQTPTGWGEYSEPLRVHTGRTESEDDSEGDTPIGIIVGSIVAVILCMAIATIMIIILLRKNRPSCSEKKDCEAYSHVIQYPPLEHHINGGYGGLTMPLFPSPGSVHSSVRTYVDPHTYEDPNQAVREFTREIDACHITIEAVIGGGEFGDVCKGKLRVPGRPEMTVAIKTLKPGATEKNRLDFLTEASIMGQFDDPNVIFLEGVVTKSNPIMIVTEYMANGSLDTFLRNNDGKFTIIQLLGMMRGVSSGMKYLSEMGFVHRDLAARNTLVNENLVCKVADFGLSREIESDTTEGAYTTTGGKIPVRWTAPEAISFRKFTSASDVWSYGVVMWEIVSYGERPYYNWSNQDVIKAVEKGYRLPPPMDCPEAIHQLMLDCWQKERSHRPKMSMIVKTLDKLIRAPELLRKQAKPRPHNFIDPSTPDMTTLSSVEDWLVSIKMDRYLGLFLSAGLTTMEHVRHLTVRDLLNMGISLVGHQKKIMNSIQTFRAQTGDSIQQHVPPAALV